MKAAQILKEKMGSGELVTGVLATFHIWPELVEICRNANLDYLIVDMEHGSHSEERVAELCALGRLIDFPVLVRPHANSFECISKIMDLGPCGLMLAMVNDTATLDEAQKGVYMPPRGKRRPGGAGNRWLKHDYNYESWRGEVEDDFIVLAQIESQTGVGNAVAIANHGLVTAIAVGPYDLSADMGVCWKPNDPALQEALATIRAAGEAAGKPMWVIGDGAELVKQGYKFVCIAEPIILLESTLKANVASLHSGEKSSGYQFGDNPV